MPVSSGTVRPGITPSTQGKTTNVTTSATPGTEASHTFDTGTKSFDMKVRGAANMQVAWVATESGTKYLSVPRGSVYTRNNLLLPAGTTVYFQVDKASQVVEIEEWK